MKYTIQTMEAVLIIGEKKFNGYAFIDEYDHCIIIVYGENKRNLIIKHLYEK